MATAVLYEQDFLPGTANGSIPEAHMASQAVPATQAAPTATRATLLTAMQTKRERLHLEHVRAYNEWQAHTGFADRDAWVQSFACERVLKAIRENIWAGAIPKLKSHWSLWTAKIPYAALTAVQARLNIDVVFPDYRQPGPNQVLTGDGFRRPNGRIEGVLFNVNHLKAADPRFEYGKPVVMLHHGEAAYWGVIVPGKYWEMGPFTYTDEQGRAWDTGTVLAECAMANTALSPIADRLREAEAVYARAYENGTKRNVANALAARVKVIDIRLAVWQQIALPGPQVDTLIRQVEMFDEADRAAPRGILLYGPPGTGKTRVADALLQSLPSAHQQRLTLADLKHQNLGASGQRVREVWTQARQNQPAVIFVDECEGVLGRRGAAETDVVASDVVQAFLAEWDRGVKGERILVVGATNRRDMLDDAILSRFGIQVELGLPGAAERLHIFRQEMEDVSPGTNVPSDMGELTQGMSGRDLRTLASRVRSLSYPSTPEPSHFHEAVRGSRKALNTKVDATATWDTLVLAPEVLDQLKLTCELLRNAESWQGQGIEVPRSLLLVGPAGTGKTQIARTLANEGGLAFLAATTADVKASFLGQSGNRVKQLFERARTKAPVILFLDELDIISPDRGGTGDALTVEIVGQLLQEMDGIEAQEGQVFLLGATNHPEQIDSAVLSRFREKILIPLPDRDARARLLAIQLGKLRIGFDRQEGAALLAAASEGQSLSGRDLVAWVTRAQNKAVKRAARLGGVQHFSLMLEDFD